jgi:hypothetical protein
MKESGVLKIKQSEAEVLCTDSTAVLSTPLTCILRESLFKWGLNAYARSRSHVTDNWCNFRLTHTATYKLQFGAFVFVFTCTFIWQLNWNGNWTDDWTDHVKGPLLYCLWQTARHEVLPVYCATGRGRAQCAIVSRHCSSDDISASAWLPTRATVTSLHDTAAPGGCCCTPPGLTGLHRAAARSGTGKLRVARCAATSVLRTGDSDSANAISSACLHCIMKYGIIWSVGCVVWLKVRVCLMYKNT